MAKLVDVGYTPPKKPEKRFETLKLRHPPASWSRRLVPVLFNSHDGMFWFDPEPDPYDEHPDDLGFGVDIDAHM
jgi:hypothetical protein